ncbi:MAG: hypothetical protein AVDCRST_MAG88-1230, partial [uncultured Thermomicrobiales bacterium]
MRRTAREGPRVTRQLHRPIGLIAQRGQVLPATAGEPLTAGAVEIVPVAAK